MIKKRNIFLILVGLIFLMTIPTTFAKGSKNWEESAIISTSTVSEHDTLLYIAGDSELDQYCADQETSGSSWEDAYIIEDLKLSGSELEGGIYIRDTTRFLIIADSEVTDQAPGTYYSGGFYIENSSNVMIRNSKAKGFDNGIFIKNSHDIKIKDNIMKDSKEDGIHLLRTKNSTVENNQVSGVPWYGICIKQTRNAVVKDNRAYDNGHYGMRLEDSRNITVTGNEIYENRLWGISVYRTEDSTIVNNNIHDNVKGQVSEVEGSDNLIENNDGPQIPGFPIIVLLIVGLVASSVLYLKKFKK